MVGYILIEYPHCIPLCPQNLDRLYSHYALVNRDVENPRFVDFPWETSGLPHVLKYVYPRVHPQIMMVQNIGFLSVSWDGIPCHHIIRSAPQFGISREIPN